MQGKPILAVYRNSQIILTFDVQRTATGFGGTMRTVRIHVILPYGLPRTTVTINALRVENGKVQPCHVTVTPNAGGDVSGDLIDVFASCTVELCAVPERDWTADERALVNGC